MSGGQAIVVSDLVKEFSRPDIKPGRFAATRGLFTRARKITRAVDGIDLEVPTGELVGFLGPNGAGKSTTIKMLSGILVPTSGTVLVDGRVPWKDRRRNAMAIGAVFGQRTQLWIDLPLRSSFEAIRDLYCVDREDYRRRLAEFTELLDLSEFIDTPARSLSLGQRMRGDLVAAMLYQPRILFLDEPTVGLDVVAKAAIREFIAATNAEHKTTIVLTTHDLDDVERLCRRIVVIDRGRILFDGRTAELKERHVTDRELTIRVDPAEAARVTSSLAQVTAVEADQVTLRFPTTTAAAAVIGDLTNRYAVEDLTLAEPRLEHVILQLYGSVATGSSATPR